MTASSITYSSTFARGANDDVAAGRTGDGTLDRDQAALGVHLDHFEPLHGLLDRTHVAGHLLAREHATRRLGLADGARRTMRQRVAVRRVAHLEVVLLDGALEALALRDAGDVDDLAYGEDVGLDLGADFEVAGVLVFDAEFPQATARFHLRLREVAGLRLVDETRALLAGGDLHGGVAVGL